MFQGSNESRRISFCVPGKHKICHKKVLYTYGRNFSEKAKKKHKNRESFYQQKFLSKHRYADANVTAPIWFQCILIDVRTLMLYTFTTEN